MGIDLGIKSLAILSDGITYLNSKQLTKSVQKLARLQRKGGTRLNLTLGETAEDLAWVGSGQRTENLPALAVESVKKKHVEMIENNQFFDQKARSNIAFSSACFLNILSFLSIFVVYSK